MFWKKKNDQLFGITLDELEQALASASLHVSRVGNALEVRHGRLCTSVVVAPPEHLEGVSESVRAVVRVETALPGAFTGHLSQTGAIGAINRLATLGALMPKGRGYVVGSRLTVYGCDEDWSTDLPLLSCAVMAGGGSPPNFGRYGPAAGGAPADASRWTEDDLRLVQSRLFKLAPCDVRTGELTAKFALRRNGMSAIAGDKYTAWWRLLVGRPHPEVGPGLLCMLDLPHRLCDEEHLARTLNDLNQMEMKRYDLPPHFGAWCPGDLGLNPAYAMFLPNGLHAVAGLALKVSVWGYHRAQWADGVLATMNSDGNERLPNKKRRR